MFTVNAGRPAGARCAIVLCADDNYQPYAMAALQQISDLAPDHGFDLCLCNSDAMPQIPASLSHLDVRACHVLVGDVFAGLRLDAGRTHDVYLRLALPAAFSNDYDRILYMDSDIFIQGGDFAGLLAVDMGAHAIGAVRDNIQWRTPGRRARQFRRLGMPARPYFNAGVLLMDVARYNEQDILARCMELGRTHADRMIRHDQNLYNGVLQGDWAELSPVWNWQYTWASRLLEGMADANLVHFIGSKKPWNHTGGELPLRFRRSYRRFLAQHFPDRALPQEDGVRPGINGPFLRKALLKHLVTQGAMSRYLSRFDDDLTVYR